MHEIKEIIKVKQYHLITNDQTKSNVFKSIYSCDLLSAVIKHGKNNPILITQIASKTTIGVATMLDLPAVIITEGKTLDFDSIQYANEENIAIIYTDLTSAEVIIDFKNRWLI